MMWVTTSLVGFGVLITSTFAYFPADGDVCTATGGSSDVCEYDFTVRRAQTLTYTLANYTGQGYPPTYDIIWNETSYRLEIGANSLHFQYSPFFHTYDYNIGQPVDADRDNIITADGVKRDVIAINNQFPCPTIQVLEGAKVKITVHNELTEVMSIHWHGLYQEKTNFMDGVPFLTQCPILPKQIFTYIFIAKPHGTHWYHSHYHTQRFDGLYGMFVVHKLPPPTPQHSLFISDWFHIDSDEMFVSNSVGVPFQGSGLYQQEFSIRQRSLDGIQLADWIYVSTLVGGRGRFNASAYRDFPLRQYSLRHNQQQVFRVVNSGALFAYEMMADDHKLTLTAADGYDVAPIEFDSVIVYPGESLDFTILGDQDPSQSYWLRAQRIGKTNNEGSMAILVYEGYSSGGDPNSTSKDCSSTNICTVFNCPYADSSATHKQCIAVHTVNSVESAEYLNNEYGINDSPDEVQTIFLNFAFVPHWTASVNARIYVPPSSGFLLQKPTDNPYITPCNDAECNQHGCPCTHIHKLTYNKTIEIVLTDYGNLNDPGHHSVHLHGHGFAILHTGFAPQDATGLRNGSNPDVQCDSTLLPFCPQTMWNVTKGRPAFNFSSRPIIKDVAVVPAQGYILLRFRATNPGLWLFHCHLDIHSSQGMALVFDEAVEMLPILPEAFPTCDQFDWSVSDFDDYLNDQKFTTNPTLPPNTSGAAVCVIQRLTLLTVTVIWIHSL